MEWTVAFLGELPTTTLCTLNNQPVLSKHGREEKLESTDYTSHNRSRTFGIDLLEKDKDVLVEYLKTLKSYEPSIGRPR
jgi:hypothetical protein